MKLLLISATLLAALLLAGVAPVFAQDMTCDMTTISGLYTCVQHAQSEGFISNAGVATGLLRQVAAAQSAYDNGKIAAAVRILQGFTATVNAQSGKTIDAEHAGHMIMHAQMLIEAISP